MSSTASTSSPARRSRPPAKPAACRCRSCGTRPPTSDAGSRTCGRTPTTRSGSRASGFFRREDVDEEAHCARARRSVRCWVRTMARPTDELEPEPKSWNIWLTLMVISIAFTIAVAVLEYFGVFRDLGVILSAVGLALALGFGISGSSQRTVELVRFDLRGIRRDLTRGFAEMSREMNRGLGEIAALLRERLPRS